MTQAVFDFFWRMIGTSNAPAAAEPPQKRSNSIPSIALSPEDADAIQAFILSSECYMRTKFEESRGRPINEDEKLIYTKVEKQLYRTIAEYLDSIPCEMKSIDSRLDALLIDNQHLEYTQQCLERSMGCDWWYEHLPQGVLVGYVMMVLSAAEVVPLVAAPCAAIAVTFWRNIIEMLSGHPKGKLRSLICASMSVANSRRTHPREHLPPRDVSIIWEAIRQVENTKGGTYLIQNAINCVYYDQTEVIALRFAVELLGTVARLESGYICNSTYEGFLNVFQQLVADARKPAA